MGATWERCSAKCQSSEMNPEPCSYAGSTREWLGSPCLSRILSCLMKQPAFSSCDETTESCCCLQLGSASLAFSMKTHLNFTQCSVSLVGSAIGVGSFLFKKRIYVSLWSLSHFAQLLCDFSFGWLNPYLCNHEATSGPGSPGPSSHGDKSISLHSLLRAG